MKKIAKNLLACVVLSATALSSFACKGGSGNSDKATLYVYSFTSGFGSEWLTSLIADYEEKMKDVEINGKKGIHIEPTAEKSDVDGSQMASRKEVIYFLEQQDYYELTNGNYIADITSAVTSANPYDADGKTLESKMFADQKSYFGRQVDGATRYYAYPHYFTSFGIVYDIDLFNEKGYYLAEGYSVSDVANACVGTEDWEKTAGPDGEKNTADDGLPATYEEFFLLCDYINHTNGNPMLWAGQYRDSYLTHFINALAADYEGYEQMRLNFTFKGEAKNLGTVSGGEFVKDAESTQIDGTNGYELARQAGKFYAMDFYNTLYNKSYIKDKSSTLYSSTYSHLKAQEDFLKSGNTAMLLDGSWWQTEATNVFNALGQANASKNKQNRNLGWMPLPRPSANADQKAVMYDIMYPLCVMKNGLDTNSWEYKYALDFIQFANSDAQLAKFTQITGCTKALNYSLDAEQQKGLTKFGQSFYNAYKNSDIVFPYANNMLYANNQLTFQELDPGTGSPLYKSTAHATCFVKAVETSVSAEKYFNGMYDYFKDDLKSIWKAV